MKRPFVYGELAQDDNFIDRQEDRKRLKTFLGNGVNVMLISPMGKVVACQGNNEGNAAGKQKHKSMFCRCF